MYNSCASNQISDLLSLDFAINRLFMKLFKTYVIDAVEFCQDYFHFDLPIITIEKRRKIFLARLDTHKGKGKGRYSS